MLLAALLPGSAAASAIYFHSSSATNVSTFSQPSFTTNNLSIAFTTSSPRITPSSSSRQNSTSSQTLLNATTTYSPGEADFWTYMDASRWVPSQCQTKYDNSRSEWSKNSKFTSSLSGAAPPSFSGHSQLFRLTQSVADKGSRVLSYTASPPCCGYCHIIGKNVTVYLWPPLDKRRELGQNSILVDNGFTL